MQDIQILSSGIHGFEDDVFYSFPKRLWKTI